MQPRPYRIGTLALLALGCATAPAAVTREPQSVETLFAADRAFCEDVLAGGLDAWMSWFEANAVKDPLEGADFAQGSEAIRAASAPIFAGADTELRWDPEAGAVLVPYELGFTRGPYELVRTGAEETVLATGTYLTLWRWSAGGWKVIYDTGVADD